MKKYFLIAVLLPFLWACENTGKDSPEMEQLKKQNEELQSQLNEKDASVNDMFNFINDVESNLAEIESRQMKISESKKAGNEVNQDVKESITEHIQNINTLLDKNKQLIASLQKKMKESNMKIDAMQKTIDLLNQQLTQKDAEIAGLKDQLAKLQFTVEELNGKVADLSTQNEQQSQVIDEQTTELNTAYYVVGTKKDLKTKGVIVGDKLSTKLNPGSFNKIDIRTMTEIKLNVKKAKVLSTHPEGSYNLVESGKAIEKIAIRDSKKFWSISKFLVIQTD